jgi:hypothetical protein
MRCQHPVAALFGVEIEGDVVGIQSVRAVRDQHPQGMLAQDAVQCFGAGFGKVGGRVHRVAGLLACVQNRYFAIWPAPPEEPVPWGTLRHAGRTGWLLHFWIHKSMDVLNFSAKQAD